MSGLSEAEFNQLDDAMGHDFRFGLDPGGAIVAAVERIVAARVGEAKREAWQEGKRAMAHARLMQGGDDPQNPYVQTDATP